MRKNEPDTVWRQCELFDDRYEIVAIRTQPVQPDYRAAGRSTGLNFNFLQACVRHQYSNSFASRRQLRWRMADFGRNALQMSSLVSI